MLREFFTLLLAGAFVDALEPYQLYSEGSCSKIHAQRARNIDRRALVGMNLVTGGSKYHLLRHASALPHPRYSSIREDELYEGYCLKNNATTLRPKDIVTMTGFGRKLASFDIVPTRDESIGSYAEAVPRDSFPSWDALRGVVTLTDNRSFMFMVTCWTESDQVGFSVLSRAPKLDENSKKMIVKHAKQLGFNEDNILFLNHEKCEEQEELKRRNQREQWGAERRLQKQGQRKPQELSNSKKQDRENVELGPKTKLIRPEIIAKINSLSKKPQWLDLRDLTKIIGGERSYDNEERSQSHHGENEEDHKSKEDYKKSVRGNSKENKKEEEGHGWPKENEKVKESHEKRLSVSTESKNSNPEERRDQRRRGKQTNKRDQGNDRNSSSGESKVDELKWESKRVPKDTQRKRHPQQSEDMLEERNPHNQKESLRILDKDESQGWSKP